MIGQTISHYKILRKLGEGGMGEVYLAEDTELERKVALKFLPSQVASDSDALERLKREARAAAALNHPNIITVYEIGRHEDQTFIAMAYIDGEQLSETLQQSISPERAQDIAIQVCEGLDKAHRAGIVHRDIKPDNLLIDQDGRVKILDFGVAMFEEPDSPSSDSSTVGTVHYMSPEQARGDDVDTRSDLFSLGTILYEMLAGKRPFKGEHSAAIEYSVLNEDPEPLSQLNPKVSPELERIVTKALSKDTESRYQSAAELAADLKALQTKAPTTRKIPWRFILPGSLVLLAFFLLYLINPFKVKITPDPGAVAGENILAIMYFENLAQQGDPGRLGEIITNLLITNLSQSEDLKVVSSQRLYDILKLQGKEGAKVIDRSTATEIAKTAGARWMMLGSILQVSPHLVITSQLVDVATGNIEASQQLTGAPGETVFNLVDRMTGDTQMELAVPLQLDIEEPPSIMDVTTSSLDAYRHYLEGLEYRYKYYAKEAGESFRKAIEYDSTFAMAHYWLAFNAITMNDLAKGLEALEKAVKYADQTSEKERLYIEALKASSEMRIEEAIAKWEQITDSYPDEKEALLWLARVYRNRNDERSIEYFKRIVAIDPLHKRSYNEMAYTYNNMGNFEKSIWAINHYIELAPDEANPYDSRADLYAFNGDIDNAMTSYQKAAEIKPDYYASVRKLANMYLHKGLYDQAEAQYKKLASSDQPAVRSVGWLYSSNIPMYQGRLRDALAALDTAAATGELENSIEASVGNFALRALIYTDLKQPDRAIEEATRGTGIMKQVLPAYAIPVDLTFAQIWAHNGKIEQADSIVTLHESALDTLDQTTRELLRAGCHTARGVIALKKNDPETACFHLETADSINPNNYPLRFLLAAAYLSSNRVNEAIELLETMLNRYDDSRLQYPPLAARGYFLLGAAYQKAGRNDESIRHFQTFLEIWKDADPDLDEVSDAKKRIQELGRGG